MRGDTIPFLPTRGEPLPRVYVLERIKPDRCYRVTVDAGLVGSHHSMDHGLVTVTWEGRLVLQASSLVVLATDTDEETVLGVLDLDRILGLEEVACD